MSIVMLKDVRLSFPELWEPTQFQGTGPWSYKASFLLPEKHTVYVKKDSSFEKTTVGDVIKSIAAEAWKDKAANVLKHVKTICWYSGDDKAYDGYAGNYVLSSSRPKDQGRPLVVNKQNTPLAQDDGRPYAGCYVNATVEMWAQDNQFGKSVRATLRGVQFVREGEAFSSSAPLKAEAEFEVLDDEDEDAPF